MYDDEFKKITPERPRDKRLRYYQNRATCDSLIQFRDLYTVSSIKPGSDGDRNKAGVGRKVLLRLCEAKHLRVVQRLTITHEKKESGAAVKSSGRFQLTDGGKHSVSLTGVKYAQPITPTRSTVNGLRAWNAESGAMLRDHEQGYRSKSKTMLVSANALPI